MCMCVHVILRFQFAMKGSGVTKRDVFQWTGGVMDILIVKTIQMK